MGMHAVLHKIERWTSKWRISVNSKKTQLLISRPRHGDDGDFNFSYQDTLLKIVCLTKYLEFNFRDNLSWHGKFKSMKNRVRRLADRR